MASGEIIYYDDEFMAKFEKLKALLEEQDHAKTYRFLIDNFGYIFTTCQHYWRYAANNGENFRDADEEIKSELLRPLSHRQYRLIEGSFSRWRDEQDLVIWSIWDFLHDEERIYNKKVMSIAEVAGCSIILENVYVRLSHKVNKDQK